MVHSTFQILIKMNDCKINGRSPRSQIYFRLLPSLFQILVTILFLQPKLLLQSKTKTVGGNKSLYLIEPNTVINQQSFQTRFSLEKQLHIP